jgi:hypothetical protein
MNQQSYMEEVRLRAQVDAILRRALEDSAFRADLQRDPQGVLERAGVPEGLAEDIARESNIDGTVHSDARCMLTCGHTCVNTSWIEI